MSKQGGWLWGAINLDTLSPEFKPNDLGFIGRVNNISPYSFVTLQKTQPWGPFREMLLQTIVSAAWNYRHHWAGKTQSWVNLTKSLDIVSLAKLKNYWGFEVNVAHSFETMSDLAWSQVMSACRSALASSSPGISTKTEVLIDSLDYACGLSPPQMLSLGSVLNTPGALIRRSG